MPAALSIEKRMMERFINDIPEDALIVTDLKNFIHCARFAYFEKCLPEVRPRVYAMTAGQEAHEEERARAKRRKLTMYGLPDGERLFNVRLYSASLNLVGILDELVIGQDRVYFPVDYKLSNKVNPSFELQIAAYAQLIEEHYTVTVTHGYIFLIGLRQLHTVHITPALRDQVSIALSQIRVIADREQMPPRIKERAKCRACEFRRFCNDVV